MARPRPSRVATFVADTDSGVNSVSSHSAPIVASTVPSATSSGRLAATRPPKTNSSAIRVSGNAIASPLAISVLLCSTVSCMSIAKPPALTCRVPCVPVSSPAIAATRWSISRSLPSTLATIRPCLPSTLRSAGWWVVQ